MIVMILSFLIVWLDGYHIQSMALVVPTLSTEWSVKATDFKLVVSQPLSAFYLGAPLLPAWATGGDGAIS